MMGLLEVYERYKKIMLPLQYSGEITCKDSTDVSNKHLITFEDKLRASFYIIMLTDKLFKSYLNDYKLYEGCRNAYYDGFDEGVLVNLTIDQLVDVYVRFRQELFKFSNWTFVREREKWIPDADAMVSAWKSLDMILPYSFGSQTLFVTVDYIIDEFENLCYICSSNKEIFLSSSDCVDTLTKIDLMGV